jgi:replication fork protection complex subunit Csm3/Swi3
MLNMYQLWLDDLYPRAKFADALAIIEKVGHTKRMQVDRKAWIDEGKPRRTTEQDEDDVDAAIPDAIPTQDQQETTEGFNTGASTAEVQPHSEMLNKPHGQSYFTAEDPDEDELDALLAESAQPDILTHKTLPSRSAPAQDDPFADEMEAMAGMDDMW